ncbi:AAA family ATPase [Adhaeribacter radiodurans]|uniref:AAA family ATPase n=1 Tax=Adhaeribacter radiodurans TaxID=2745197 RepID=A0A7L7LF97_9BACT|nr:AAA family ATPase [Adhaeribacter radiodurans]QMU31364.1 AAA family ATPase [Adhaeribacter radiodurans]
MIKHISNRVAWHDNKWNGTICQHPAGNTFCIHLPRIYQEKNENAEEVLANRSWSNLKLHELPPCKAEGGAFMNELSYKRQFNHPYNKRGGKDIPHLNLRPTTVEIPPFTTFTVPFWWMLRGNQAQIDNLYPGNPKDADSPFPSAWVYGRERQETILKTFFEPVTEDKSLSIFYVKGANPVDEDSRRLIVGIGIIKKKSSIIKYDSVADYTYPLWDRLITHGIRPDDPTSEGILLPYHDYLALPEDYVLKTKDGKKTKNDLLDEIKLTLQETATRQEAIEEFTHGTEWLNNSTVLVVLGKLRSIVERIKEHGIASGFWDNHLMWIDRQVGQVKEAMGPFPSFANALQAIGFQYGHSLEEDLRAQGILGIKDNPWNAWEDVLSGRLTIRPRTYSKDLPFLKDTWFSESGERKELLQLLSRLELTEKQIKNWFELTSRRKLDFTCTDSELLTNPYLIAEKDTGDQEHYPIAVETIDNGLFEDKAIQGEYVPKEPQLVKSPLDPRRLRAIIIDILKRAAENGDTLLAVNEITETLNTLNLRRPVQIPANYIAANIEFLKEQLNHLSTDDIQALQLKIYEKIESSLRKIVLARAKRELEPLGEDWEKLIVNTIRKNGKDFDPGNNRHVAALHDQRRALQLITSRKLSVLHGPAGTGKTTVMGALFSCSALKSEGILLLAPTGKARVKLGKMAGGEAYTIAQFLTRQKRFDWDRMKPKFTGESQYKGEQNVIIDECSMLTEDDLFAIFQALDQAHVKRIILVGDPYQLPPIGAGRPFADICAKLETLEETDPDFKAASSLARIKEIVRTAQGEDSDTLMLASWFSGMKPSKNADIIFSKLGNNTQLNDLQLSCWQNEEELITKLNETLVNVLNLDHAKDYDKLNAFLGISYIEKKGKSIPEIDTQRIEAFQLLSPVKAPYWGSFNLNRKFQQQFRKGIQGGINIGEYQIGLFDKVIQTINEKKNCFPGDKEFQLSNGQLGLVQGLNYGFANVSFAGIDEKVTFGYKGQGQAENESSNIELAYAITVHKSQGSDFEYVFLIIPKTGRIISRELIYTALTRAKKKLILLVEGTDPHWLINLSKPQFSTTAKRNTHLFKSAVRESKSEIPFAAGLIHKTKKEGLLVRSKSEVIIANMLLEKGIKFEYEREFKGKNGQKRIPDFSFIDAAGDLVILEHLGMMAVPSYREDWEKKLKFYQENGFALNENLFITSESENGGIDSIAIERIIAQIEEVCDVGF